MSEKYTESEEMYLVNIASLQEGGISGAVSLSSLAAALNVQPVSVNQKVHELANAGLVTYKPYHGVELTESGLAAAMNILRHRRLWEVFMVDRLKFTAEEAAALACRLEHTLPPEAAERLNAYLGNPSLSPTGRPIPASEGAATLPPARPAASLAPGDQGQILEVRLDPAGRNYLAQQGIMVGGLIKILAASSNGDLLVSSDRGIKVALAAELAAEIFISSAH